MMVGQGGVEFSLQSCILLCMQFICQDHLVILSLISHPQNHGFQRHERGREKGNA